MRWLIGLLLLLWALAALAIDPGPAFDDPELQARYQTIIGEIRCVQCQNEPIKDSNARIAEDLRREVRRLISEGKTDAEIYDFLVARYGEFVLYRPPMKGRTLIIWLMPGILFLIGGWVVWRIMRRRFAMPVGDEDL